MIHRIMLCEYHLKVEELSKRSIAILRNTERNCMKSQWKQKFLTKFFKIDGDPYLEVNCHIFGMTVNCSYCSRMLRLISNVWSVKLLECSFQHVIRFPSHSEAQTLCCSVSLLL